MQSSLWMYVYVCVRMCDSGAYRYRYASDVYLCVYLYVSLSGCMSIYVYVFMNVYV